MIIERAKVVSKVDYRTGLGFSLGLYPRLTIELEWDYQPAKVGSKVDYRTGQGLSNQLRLYLRLTIELGWDYLITSA